MCIRDRVSTQSTGTTMYMQGFVSQVQDGSHEQCVNLFFTEWTLDNATKFAFACLGVFFVSLLIQGIPLLKKHIIGSKHFDGRVQRVLVTLLFGLDKTLSYFLMLVAMTYSVELFCMVISGMTVGYLVFQVLYAQDLGGGAWGDPCCKQEEEDEKLLSNTDAAPTKTENHTTKHEGQIQTDHNSNAESEHHCC
eukprot:TRINITY_DN1828_c0_g4_i1.p1 TRINITY_DN1828_c0_g4~~TRINITY_DN1828_c0_g4_i1.p1  ORF type:complete len:193 (+),score=28.87 TRINITY_DN1828_c0_g4_i1:24-602(+)